MPSLRSWRQSAGDVAVRAEARHELRDLLGGFCRSASRVTMTSPRATLKPAETAGCWPKLRWSLTPTRFRILGRGRLRMTFHVPSVEPSSTMISSYSQAARRRPGVRANQLLEVRGLVEGGHDDEMSSSPGLSVAAGFDSTGMPLLLFVRPEGKPSRRAKPILEEGRESAGAPRASFEPLPPDLSGLATTSQSGSRRRRAPGSPRRPPASEETARPAALLAPRTGTRRSRPRTSRPCRTGPRRRTSL